MNLTKWIIPIGVMTLVLYLYTAIIQPMIAEWANPATTYGFPLVMAIVVVLIYTIVVRMVQKRS